MKIEVLDGRDNVVFRGEYEYLENISKNDKPSFYISTHKEDSREPYDIFFYCDNKEELKEIIEVLKGLL